jgi:hypothetical protein
MKNLTPLKAIRAKCIDCSGGQLKEVRECIITDCPLYPFRMGTNPNRAGVGKRTLKRKKADSRAEFSQN